MSLTCPDSEQISREIHFCVTPSLLEDARHAPCVRTQPKLVVHVLAGIPGSGKSAKMILEAASAPGRYLFAVPTINLLEEQAERFAELAAHTQCVRIHSKDRKRGSVARQINDLMSDHSDADHVAAFITHEAMMEADLSGFHGWHARIDEPPNAITCGKVNLGQSVAVFQQHFALEPFGAGWSKLRPLGNAASWKSFAEDSMWSSLTDFRKLAMRPQGMFIKLTEWSQVNQGSLPWFSLWTPLELRTFESITIAGAGFLSSTAYKVMISTFAELDFRPSVLGKDRVTQPRVRLFYFTQGHRGSTTFWGSSEGRKCLVAAEQWLSANVPDLCFWSGNEAVRHSMEHRLPGKMVSPKVAGLNRYRDATSCAFFYSSKALPQDEVLKSVFELTDADIFAAREVEDVFQFVMRGAIRNPDFGGAYDVYLYSVDQAEHLRDIFATNGLADVELVPVSEAGIMDVSRPGRPSFSTVTPVDREAREKKRKEGNARRNKELRLRKKAAKAHGEAEGS